MLLGLSLVGVACSSDDSTEETTDTTAAAAECTEFEYALALQFPETGDAGGLGAPMLKGAQLAIDEFNAENPDMCVELIKFDTQGDPAQAPALAQSAIDNAKILGIMGPGFSGETKAAMPLYQEAGLAVLSGSATNPDLTNSGWTNFHRILADDSVQGPAIGKFIVEELGSSAVFVIDDASDYGKGLADQVTAAVGAGVVGTDTIDPAGTDYSAAVTAAGASGADTVFFGGYYAEAVKLSTQMADAGVEAQLVFGDGVKDQAGYADAAGPAAEGAIIACPCKDGPEDFLAAWDAAYGEVPGTYGAEYYDVANVFLSIIKAGATTREAVLAGLEAYDAAGITKNIKFLENGNATEAATIYFYTVQDGKITYTSSIS
jgi:branched-chain amino acid transport system substrate-binding protein